MIEAVLEPPRQVLWAQQHEARGEAIGAMKADGIEYDERMRLLEEVTWPRPLAELLEATYELYRESHPWLDPEALEPKTVVREMWEQGMGFTDFVGRYQLARSEGLVLRYLTDAYRTLRQTVPEKHRSPELDELVEWLGETVRQIDSSLLDEWEALADPAHVRAGRGPARPAAAAAADLGAGPPVPRDDPQRAVAPGRAGRPRRRGRPGRAGVRDRPARGPAAGGRDDAHPTGTPAWRATTPTTTRSGSTPTPAARRCWRSSTTGRVWSLRQTLHDPAGDHDWVIEATVDLDASDAAGEAVVLASALRRLDG